MCHSCSHWIVFVRMVNTSKGAIRYFHLSFRSSQTKTKRFKGVGQTTTNHCGVIICPGLIVAGGGWRGWGELTWRRWNLRRISCTAILTIIATVISGIGIILWSRGGWVSARAASLWGAIQLV